MAHRASQVEEPAAAGQRVAGKIGAARQPAVSDAGVVSRARGARVPPALGGPAGVRAMQGVVGNGVVMRMLDAERTGAAATGQLPAVQATLADELDEDEESVQRVEGGLREPSDDAIRAAAAEGVRTPSTTLPYLDRIQVSFGRHSIGHVQAHVGPEASRASRAMNALAYASGDHVVFGATPDLRTAAHEAAHIVQQQAGVRLSGGIGREGDTYERYADAVADAVVVGRSAEGLLESHAEPARHARTAVRSVGHMTEAGHPAPAIARAVQRKVQFVNDEGHLVMVACKRLGKVQERENVGLTPLDPPLSETEFIDGLSWLADSQDDYGVIDLQDPQHLLLLYGYVREEARQRRAKNQHTAASRENEKPEHKEGSKAKMNTLPGTKDAAYRVAFLGAGASIAYYVATQRFNPGEAVIIGTEQPWREQRGPGVVGHPEHMITPKLGSLDKTPVTDQWMERGAFSDEVEEVLATPGIDRIPGRVTALERVDGWYKITYQLGGGAQQAEPVYARQVVAGIGLGEHAAPGGMEPGDIARKPDDVAERRIMDMDVFTRVAGQLKKEGGALTVVDEKEARPTDVELVLSGGNAAIDVAFDAVNRGYKVHWIVGNTGPKFLAGFPNYAVYLAYLRSLTEEQVQKRKIDRIRETDKATTNTHGLYESQASGMFREVEKRFRDENTKFAGIHFGRSVAVNRTDMGGVSVKVEDAEKNTFDVRGDIMVFAQGPTDNSGLFSKFLKDLVPEKDVNRRFTDAGDASIGLRTPDDSLKIVGAAAYRLISQIGPVDAGEEMKRHYAALASAVDGIYKLKSARYEFWEEFSNVRSAYYAVGLAAHLASWQDEEKAKQLKTAIKNFASACVRYDKFSEQMKQRKSFPVSQEEAAAASGAVAAFEKVLAEARTNAQQRMEPVINSLPNNVLINDQLTPIRSQIVVSTNFLPYDIGMRADFTTYDRTALAIHISALYEDLADKLADEKTPSGETRFEVLIKKIIESRKKKIDGGPSFVPVPPHGKEFQDDWKSKLEKLNKANPEEQEAALMELGVTRALPK